MLRQTPRLGMTRPPPSGPAWPWPLQSLAVPAFCPSGVTDRCPGPWRGPRVLAMTENASSGRFHLEGHLGDLACRLGVARVSCKALPGRALDGLENI